ncbi:uncharacterized protein [Coffea arabica]|uniref:DUF4283 domain-containing protein n=1 Tax=Coffea arabica TaxID=13443 RepID=A0ABM4VH10_COFAR
MAAAWLPNPTQGDIRRPSKSFADIVAGKDLAGGMDTGTLGYHRGEPALVFSRQDLLGLAKPYRNALVGMFAFNRPPMEVIRRFFVTLGLEESCSVGLLDAKHVLIRPEVEKDYTKLFVRCTWYIQKSPMQLSKWSIDFKAGQDCIIIPISVNLPGLPFPFFDKKLLLKIGSLIGRPLQVDAATLNIKRPSVARLLIEVDVAKPPLPRVWLGDEEHGQWQKVQLEVWPSFCGHCERIGHGE